MNARTSFERDAVAVTCAISAGIHAALVPGHPAFAPAAVLLAAATVAALRRPGRRTAAATAALLAGLLGAYGFALTMGVPLLHPHVEGVDGLALFTKAVELLGLAAALDLVRAERLSHPYPKGTTA